MLATEGLAIERLGFEMPVIDSGTGDQADSSGAAEWVEAGWVEHSTPGKLQGPCLADQVRDGPRSWVLKASSFSSP